MSWSITCTMLMRGLTLWLSARLALLMVTLGEFGFSAGHPALLGLLAAAMAWADLTSRDELVFFANLGIGTRSLIALYVLPAIALELTIMVLQ